MILYYKHAGLYCFLVYCTLIFFSLFEKSRTFIKKMFTSALKNKVDQIAFVCVIISSSYHSLLMCTIWGRCSGVLCLVEGFILCMWPVLLSFSFPWLSVHLKSHAQIHWKPFPSGPSPCFPKKLYISCVGVLQWGEDNQCWSALKGHKI